MKTAGLEIFSPAGVVSDVRFSEGWSCSRGRRDR
jgi:hypothetical protein